MAEKADKKAEKPKEEAHAAEGESAPKKKGGLLTKTPVLVGGIMLIEAIALFGAVKFLGIGAPKAAQAEVTLKQAKDGEDAGAAEGEAAAGKAEEGKEEKKDEKAAEGGHEGGEGEGGKAAAPKEDPNAKKPVNGVQEVDVVNFKATNRQSGKPYVYQVEVVALVKVSNLKKVENVLKGRKSTLEDRIRTIIAQSDPDKLSASSEPGLETLRRQIKHEVELLSGEGSIIEIVVPKCLGFPT